MAASTFAPAFTAPVGRPSAVASVARRFVNALVASRAASAERELRRRGFFNESALVNGEFRKIGLDKADLLPFNG
jgi:hypothetical protein